MRATEAGWWKRYLQRLRENRAFQRRPSAIPVKFWWQSEGGGRVIHQGICVDVSEGGMGIVYTGAMVEREYLYVELETDRVMKCAQVRHCEAIGSGHLMGVRLAPGSSAAGKK